MWHNAHLVYVRKMGCSFYSTGIISGNFDVGGQKIATVPRRIASTLVDVRLHQKSIKDWPPRLFRGFNE